MTTEQDEQVDLISFPLRPSIFLGIIGLILLAFYSWKVNDVDKSLVFFALLTAGLGQLLVSFYTARTLAAIVKRDKYDLEKSLIEDKRKEEREKAALDRQERLDEAASSRARLADAAETRRLLYEKRREALKFGTRWNDPQMTSARDTLRQISSKRAAPQEVINFANENVVAVNHIMNFFEEIGTACRSDLVDSELLKISLTTSLSIRGTLFLSGSLRFANQLDQTFGRTRRLFATHGAGIDFLPRRF